jgi:putative holliday junction resolvase
LRVLGVDLGSKRIGIAVGERGFGVASPRPALTASGTLSRDADAISALARREQVDLVVVGVPENDQDPRMANVCRKLGGLIESGGLKVAFVDESLTSVHAEDRLLEAQLKGSERRRRRDGEAACLILERFFHEEVS